MQQGTQKIALVPSAEIHLDLILSAHTQKLPKVVHLQYHLIRIRSYCINEVRSIAKTLHSKLDEILSEFPNLNNLHPFYTDLINTFYDLSNCKRALSRINSAKIEIKEISKVSERDLKITNLSYLRKSEKRVALNALQTQQLGR